MTSLQRQFQGFLNTPFLWLNSSTIKLYQFHFQHIYNKSIHLKIENKLRLGKLVEQFVFEELKQDDSIKILAENIQVQNDKITIGELDCLLLQRNIPVHLEIVYKFYLYDASAGNSDIERWVGPNRRDSFIQKLTKLKKKQLPLLYHEKTKPYLNKFNLSSEEVVQNVYFKAQLFVPLTNFGKTFPIINNDCIYGFYIYPKELSQFSDCKFYIPTKHNWLVEPYPQIDWFNYENFKQKLNIFLSEENSPLCWMKKQNGELHPFFVVWW